MRFRQTHSPPGHWQQDAATKLVAQKPDATLAELGAQFKRHTSTIDLWLSRLGLSCKKNATRRGAIAARRGGTKKAVVAAAGKRARRAPGVPG